MAKLEPRTLWKFCSHRNIVWLTAPSASRYLGYLGVTARPPRSAFSIVRDLTHPVLKPPLVMGLDLGLYDFQQQ
jgi:hypothetical protein